MSRIDEILAYNQAFVDGKQYEAFGSTRFPSKKTAVLSCMDTRLTELLPAALHFKNGEIKIIKNAGAVITHPFGSVMRSLLVAVYELGVEDILVIGHYDCGMQGLEASRLIQKMLDRKISQDKIDMVAYAGIDLHKWLGGFDDAQTSVRETVALIENHPFIPADVQVHGFMMDPQTGKLSRLESGLACAE